VTVADDEALDHVEAGLIAILGTGSNDLARLHAPPVTIALPGVDVAAVQGPFRTIEVAMPGGDQAFGGCVIGVLELDRDVRDRM
jgi:hypothetical protein